MSTRTHAPECAKALALGMVEDMPEHPCLREHMRTTACTCFAEYQPSVEEQLAQAERERDEARDRADELRIELGGSMSNAQLWRRWPHPWEKSNG